MPRLTSILMASLLIANLPTPARAGEPPITFQNVAARAGVAFRFHTGSRGQHDLPEIMGGGLGWIDVDADGWLDLYVCDGGPIAPNHDGHSPQVDPPCRLFRNNRDGTFADVTDRAHAPGPSYAMGVAVGDYDGDGRDDLFVTGWRDQRLYRNNGNGTFTDTTERAGVTSKLWSTSAAFADLDADGDLDLYVANYLAYDPALAPYCAAPDSQRDYCGPEDFAAQPDRLYRNNGDGTFTDVSRQAGIDLPGGRGLGVLIADLTGDRLPDIVVANDGTPCWLFANRGGLHFEEVGAEAGVALDGQGNPLAGMGVALADLDGDGRPDLVVTNFYGRSTVAFQALGGGRFADASAALGLSVATRDVLGFGVALDDLDADGRPDLVITNFYGRSTVAFQALGCGRFADASAALGLSVATRDVLGFGITLDDLDADGRPDLLQANGHVLDRARLKTPFAMRPTLLRNVGNRLADASTTAGPWFTRPILARGLAPADFDNDHRPDAAIAALDAPAALLHNTTPGGHALTIDLPDHPYPVGATIRAQVGPRTLVLPVVSGGSYLSAPDRRLTLGLGPAHRVDRLTITWPSGRQETWTNLAAGQTHQIRQGKGRPIR